MHSLLILKTFFFINSGLEQSIYELKHLKKNITAIILYAFIFSFDMMQIKANIKIT